MLFMTRRRVPDRMQWWLPMRRPRIVELPGHRPSPLGPQMDAFSATTASSATTHAATASRVRRTATTRSIGLIDVVSLMDHLNIAQAHVCGISSAVPRRCGWGLPAIASTSWCWPIPAPHRHGAAVE